MNRRLLIAGLVLCAVFLLVLWRIPHAMSEGDVSAPEPVVADRAPETRAPAMPQTAAGRSEEPPADDGEPAAEEEEPQLTEEEKAEAEAERRVEAFDELTDAWRESGDRKVTLKDVEAFSAQFRQVPEARREECLQRALNLIPDENIMLLAGVLMDKTMPKEQVEQVFNDVLNRDENYKKPILLEIFKDKDHPCWADTAWILDVTGELPAKKE